MKSKALRQLSGPTAFMRLAIDVAPRYRSWQVRVKAVCFVVAIVIATPGLTRAQAPQALLHEYKCYICHADNETKTGPAYVDVAAKYRGNRKAVAAVAAVVKKGSNDGGPWHMPPHPEVSDADARTMARYILSLKR